MTKMDEAVRDHEFIEVGNRRWCLRCDLFQMRKTTGWYPMRAICSHDTPYALRKLRDRAMIAAAQEG